MGGVSPVSEAIRVSEIFGPTIQGEGALIGQPTVFCAHRWLRLPL